jgi:hypothetical protein
MVYFVTLWFENRMLSVPELYGIYYDVMSHPLTYIVLIFSGTSIYILDMVIIFGKTEIHKRMKVENQMKMEKKKVFYRYLEKMLR